MKEKRCSKCGETKLATAEFFYRDSTKSTRLRGDCKVCCGKYDRIRNKTPKRIAYDKAKSRRIKYGVADEWVQERLELQKGICPVCESDLHDPALKKGFSIDHDHDTGEVRGILCHRCNAGIGHLLDDPHVLKNAYVYLNLATQSNELTRLLS